MSLPPSSPRLPSPPPPAEIQIGPKSPLMDPNAARQAAQMEQSAIDTNAKRRIHPGTKSADMAAGPPLVPLHELDSAFQLQEHLAALHYYHTASHTAPVSRETAKLLATPPPGIDKTLWLYELCRFLIAQCNGLIVGFLFDTPPCSASTCPEMRAGEWQFLCAVHDTPKSCCAIDYCCHTLDWAANVVTNPKIFPSRFVVDAHDKSTAVKNLVNVFRRLHRIFAHAWFQHRGVFWSVEAQSGLYVFFKTVCDAYDLLPAENYKLPPEAEGLDSSSGDLGDRGADKRQQQQQQHPVGPVSIIKPPSRDGDDGAVGRTNTRRHIKSSPSTGSAVTTVPEADEDESADLSHRLREMSISAPTAPADDDHGWAGIPVIVDHKPEVAGEPPLRPSSVVPPPGTAASEHQPATEAALVKQVVEVTGAEAGFAAEPEILTKPETEPQPASSPELAPESKGESKLAPKEAPPPTASVKQQQKTEEQPAAAASEEPAPENKAAESETHETTTQTASIETEAASPATDETEESAKTAENPEETSSTSLPELADKQEDESKPKPGAGAERQGGDPEEQAKERETGPDEAEAASSEEASDTATVTEAPLECTTAGKAEGQEEDEKPAEEKAGQD